MNRLQDVPEDSTPGPATTPTQGPPKFSENTAKQDLHPPDLSTQNIVAGNIVYETDEEEFGDVADYMELEERQEYKEECCPGTLSNGLSNAQLVTIGQSNGSPERVQDEHPWLKTVHEEDDERGEGAGEQEVVYETDEEEFMLPGRSRPGSTTTQAASVIEAVPKRKRSRTSKQRGYQLAYFTLWWSRMLREGVKEEEARSSKEDRDQHIERWTTWTDRSGYSTKKTNVIRERTLMISEISTDVNTLFVGRGDALITGGTSEGNCGVGEVTVGNDIHLMDEAQNISTSIFDEIIIEQHHEGTQDTGTGDSLAETLVGGHLGAM